MSEKKGSNKGLVVFLVIALVVAVGAWSFVIKLYIDSKFSQTSSAPSMETNTNKETNTQNQTNDSNQLKTENKSAETQSSDNSSENMSKSYDFEFDNISFNVEFGITEVIGEVKNNTSYTRSITFSINLYDDDGNLLATTPGIANDIPAGGKKVFSTHFINEYPNATNYNIQINNTF
ncbi:MAG: hypothetical protein GX333_01655 [Syntrophomonadaceae bacterium]|nr:hypothetical protein [Syntrophomonadaceae bacterium]